MNTASIASAACLGLGQACRVALKLSTVYPGARQESAATHLVRRLVAGGFFHDL
jgi:hypothetical protein